MAVALQSVTCTTVRGDGCVHFGDVLQLANVASAAFMTCDIEDRVSQLSHVSLVMSNPTLAAKFHHGISNYTCIAGHSRRGFLLCSDSFSQRWLSGMQHFPPGQILPSPAKYI